MADPVQQLLSEGRPWGAPLVLSQGSVRVPPELLCCCRSRSSTFCCNSSTSVLSALASPRAALARSSAVFRRFSSFDRSSDCGRSSTRFSRSSMRWSRSRCTPLSWELVTPAGRFGSSLADSNAMIAMALAATAQTPATISQRLSVRSSPTVAGASSGTASGGGGGGGSGRDEILLPGRGDGGGGDVDEDRGGGRSRRSPGHHVGLPRQAVPLAPVAGGAAGDDVLPARRAALGARDHVVHGQAAALVPAVLAGPAVTSEHGAARDLAPVRVTRDLHVGHEADYHRARQR